MFFVYIHPVVPTSKTFNRVYAQTAWGSVRGLDVPKQGPHSSERYQQYWLEFSELKSTCNVEESWSSKEDAHTKRKTRKWLSSPTYTYVNPVDVLDGEYWHRICVSQTTATNGAVFMETKSSISEAVSLQNITTGQRSNWFDIDRHSLKPLNFYERHENRRVERNG